MERYTLEEAIRDRKEKNHDVTLEEVIKYYDYMNSD